MSVQMLRSDRNRFSISVKIRKFNKRHLGQMEKVQENSLLIQRYDSVPNTNQTSNEVLNLLDTTAHLLEWPRFKTLTTSTAGDDEEKETLICYVGNAKMIQTLWKTLLQFLSKPNILLPYGPTIAYSKTHPHKNLHRDVYCSFINNCNQVGEQINCNLFRQWNISQC